MGIARRSGNWTPVTPSVPPSLRPLLFTLVSVAGVSWALGTSSEQLIDGCVSHLDRYIALHPALHQFITPQIYAFICHLFIPHLPINHPLTCHPSLHLSINPSLHRYMHSFVICPVLHIYPSITSSFIYPSLHLSISDPSIHLCIPLSILPFIPIHPFPPI